LLLSFRENEPRCKRFFVSSGRKEKETLKRKIVIANARKSILLLRQVRRYDDDFVIIVGHLFVSSAVRILDHYYSWRKIVLEKSWGQSHVRGL